jgi:ribosomal protein L12E/L44/L45/RPP1/RPP2
MEGSLPSDVPPLPPGSSPQSSGFPPLPTDTFYPATFDAQSKWMKENIYTPASTKSVIFGFSITGGGANIIDLLNRSSSSSCFMFANMPYATYESYKYGQKYMDSIAVFDRENKVLNLSDGKKLESVSPALAYTLALSGKDKLIEINHNFPSLEQKTRLISVSFTADYGDIAKNKFPRFCAHVIECDKDGTVKTSHSYVYKSDMTTGREDFNKEIVLNILGLLKAHIENNGLQFTEVNISATSDKRMHFSEYDNTSELCKAINDKYIAEIDEKIAQNKAATAAAAPAAEVTTDGGAGRSRRRRNIKKKKTKSRHR